MRPSTRPAPPQEGGPGTHSLERPDRRCNALWISSHFRGALSHCYTRESRKTWGLHAQLMALSTRGPLARHPPAPQPSGSPSRAPRAALPAQLPAPHSSQAATYPAPTVPIIPTMTPREGGLGTCPWSVSLETSGCQNGVPGTEGLLTGVWMASRAPTAQSGPRLPAVGSARGREWVLITTGRFCH